MPTHLESVIQLNNMKKNSNRMITAGVRALGVVIALGFVNAVYGQVEVVNVDLNGRRTADPYGATYSGISPAGGGSVFNGIQVDNSSASDMISLSGSSLLSSTGAASLVTFSFSNPVASSDAGAGGVPAAETALLNDYIFINGGNNSVGSTVITFSNLGGATADLYFYNRPDFSNALITIAGSSSSAFTPVSIFNSGNTLAFFAVPIVGGQITATFSGVGSTSILSGFSIAAIPEPGTMGLVSAGLALALLRRRRRS